MDKQEQIEEIADALYNSQYEYDLSNPFEVAKIIINAGYRKIPENAVVLTGEEYEKFAERVKMAFYYEFDELIPSIMADKIDEICKEITDKGLQNEN